MRYLRTFAIYLTIVLGTSLAHAADVPQSFTLDGKLYKDTAATQPLLDGSIGLKVQIIDDAQTCVMYEESQTVSTLASNGYFSVQVGTPTGSVARTAGDSGNSMVTVFQNINNVTGKLLTNGNACTVIATGGNRRYVRVTISPSTMGGTPRVLSPDVTLDSVPNSVIAERAETLQGARAADFVRINTTGTNVLTQSNVESLFSSAARFSSLTSVVDGTSTAYMRSNSASGALLPVITGAPTGPSTGSIWFDTTDSKVKYQTSGGPLTLATSAGSAALSSLTPATTTSTIDNTNNALIWNWSTAVGETPLTMAAPLLTTGSLLDLSAGTPTTGSVLKVTGTSSASTVNGILNVTNSGASSTGVVARIQANSTTGTGLTVLANGNVGVGTTSPSATLSVNGNVSGTHMSIAGVNPASASFLYIESSTANTYGSGNNQNGYGIALSIPHVVGQGNGLGFVNNSVTTSGVYGYTSDTTSYGRGGLAFRTNPTGAGGLSTRMIIDPTGNVGIGTTVPATALDLNGAWSIRGMAAPAVSVAGQGRIYFDSTANKFKVSENNGAYVDLVGGGGTSTLADGKIFVGNASNVATAQTAGGDVSLINDGTFTVNKIKNVSVSAAAPNDGQVLKYVSGTTSWTPSNFSIGDLKTAAGAQQFAGSTSCAADQTLTWSSLTDTFTCTDGPWKIASGNVYRTTGNVGIGTTAPGVKFSVEVADSSTTQASSGWAATIANSDQTANNWVGFGFADAQTGTLSTSIQTKFTDHTNNYGELHFGTRGASGWASRLMIDQNGNVGIGTTAPATALDLEGAWSIRGMAAPAVSAAGQGRIYFDSTANKFKVSENNGAYVDLVGGGGSISGLTTGKIPKATSATTIGDSVIAESSGRIGIGTTSPSGVLHVVGTTPGSGSAPNAITATGAAGASNGAGGGFSFAAGAGTGSGSGGSISAIAGTGGATGTGGTVTISGGAGGSTSGASGGVTISGGNGQATSGGGTVGIIGGTYGTYGGASIYLYGSGSVTTGAIGIATASGNGIIGSAGSITTTLGSAGSGLNGSGGSFTVTAGSGDGTGSGGSITMTAGAGGATNVNGSNITLNGGAKGGTGTDGNVILANSRGFVGVGTNAPAAKLHVRATSATMMVDSSAASNYSTFDISKGGSPYGTLASYGASNDFHVLSRHASGSLQLGAGGVQSFVTLLPAGNVGIGTTAPATALDLNGAWSIRGMAAPSVSVAGQGRIYFDSTDNKFKVSENNGAYVDLVGGGGGISGLTTGVIPKATSATTIGDSIITESSGKIGIGTTVPATTLHVEGAVRMVDGNQGADRLMASDANGTGAWTIFPKFSASASSGQTMPNATMTKLVLGTEAFDTTNSFDSVTNSRFQPATAGYYQITGSVTGTTCGSDTAHILEIKKNGVGTRSATVSTKAGLGMSFQVVDLLYLNGSSDYIELYGYTTCGTSYQFNGTLSGYRVP